MPNSVNSHCNGSRRELLRTGLGAFASLSLPTLMRLRAEAPAVITGTESTAIIVVWLRGGASHLETYDPKPDAPSEYRGPFGPIATKTSGLRLGELLPKHASVAHRFSILRSMAHTGGGHPAGSLQLLAGDPDAADKLKPVYPDFMSVAHRLRFGPSDRFQTMLVSTQLQGTTTSPLRARAILEKLTRHLPSWETPIRPDFVFPT